MVLHSSLSSILGVLFILIAGTNVATALTTFGRAQDRAASAWGNPPPSARGLPFHSALLRDVLFHGTAAEGGHRGVLATGGSAYHSGLTAGAIAACENLHRADRYSCLRVR